MNTCIQNKLVFYDRSNFFGLFNFCLVQSQDSSSYAFYGYKKVSNNYPKFLKGIIIKQQM